MLQKTDVILFMGQSNMAGRGITSPLWPQEAPVPIPGAGWEYRAVTAPDRLSPLVEPFGVNENDPGGIDDGSMKTGSMVTAFVNAYFRETGVPVCAVSASKGGSPLRYWETGGAPMNDALRRLERCRTLLKELGLTIRHCLAVWCQGETDGDLGTAEEEFRERFTALRDTLRSAGVEQVFTISIGRCNIPGSFERYDRVITWEKALAEELEGVTMVSDAFAAMRERGLMKDAFHYFQEGYNECGTEAGGNAGRLVRLSEPIASGGTTIGYLQSYIRRKDHTPGAESQYFLKLAEELGELGEAIRKDRRRIPGGNVKGTIDEELWDVIYYCITLANLYGIDLEKTIAEKEKLNNEKYASPIGFEQGR